MCFNSYCILCYIYLNGKDPEGYNGTSFLSYNDGDVMRRQLLKLWIEDENENIGGYRYAQAPMIVFEKGAKVCFSNSRIEKCK